MNNVKPARGAALILDRRRLLLAAGGLLATPLLAATRPVEKTFPRGFLWGAATSGHQTEGNNSTSDTWYLEHTQPTAFREPSGDACDSFSRWPEDLDLVRGLGLNAYRFSIEWARIEPEEGQFSRAMLDHYRRIVEGCRERGLTPVVTFNHFTCPRWFAARGGWLHAGSAALFARYCERTARHIGSAIGHAVTLNEPNLMRLLKWLGLPPQVFEGQRAMLSAAARSLGVEKFSAANATNLEDLDLQLENQLAAHVAGRAAIKGVLPSLPVGVSIAITDDQAVGRQSRRDEKRAYVYGAWLEAAKSDDFLGVQNYDRMRLDAKGNLPPPEGSARNSMGAEIYPPSLAGAVRYAHSVTGKPIFVTEHGVSADDDALRAAFIPAALRELKAAIDAGVPVIGYLHWSLLDNYEWIFGFGPKFGLIAVDRQTFRRSPKPSAGVLGAIARRNALAE
jgi:beta-glucosidase